MPRRRTREQRRETPDRAAKPHGPRAAAPQGGLSDSGETVAGSSHNYPAEPGQLGELKLELSPRVSMLSSLQEMVEAFGAEHEIPDSSIYLVNLEIDELLTNYVKHSIHMISNPRIEVRLRAFADRLVLVVVDTGPPFNPWRSETPDLTSGLHDRQPGGLGLYIVRSSADRMHYETVNGCNVVRVEHDLAAPQPEAE